MHGARSTGTTGSAQSVSGGSGLGAPALCNDVLDRLGICRLRGRKHARKDFLLWEGLSSVEDYSANSVYLESCGAGFVPYPVHPSRRTESANHWVASTPTHSILILPSFLVITFQA